MSATVVIPKHLARHFNRSQIHVDALNLKDALEALSRDYHLQGVLMTTEGHLQPFIRVAIDEDLVASGRSDDLIRVSVAGKTIRIMTAFAGG